MSKIDFKLVSAIREATGAALQTCKRALEDAKGNVESAVENVKKMGYAVAQKKADRATSEGCIVGQIREISTSACRGGLLECQSETDFVGTNEIFVEFAKKTLDIALKEGVTTLDALLNLPFEEGQTIEQARQTLIGKVGENVRISRYECVETTHHLGSYVHKGRYGCIAEIKGANAQTAKDIAVHVVVSHPSDMTELLQQDFYKDPSKTIEAYLKEQQAELLQYSSFVLGS